jgi:predicted dehydrogenase
MPERLRCGVIGAGASGIEHLNSLLHCPRATAVALAEIHPQRAKDATDRFKIPRSYADYHELLDQPDIDAVTIAVPNHLHARIALDALQARKHVLVEKPMALDPKEAEKIVDTAKRMKRTLMVGHSLRFNRHTQAARSLFERGDLGEIYHARCFWLKRSGIPRIGSWYTQKQFAGGGSLFDLGAEILDACLHLLGEFEVRTVSAQSYAKFGSRGLGEVDWGKSDIDPKRPFDVDDGTVALLRLKSGRTISLECSWAGHHAPDAREQGIDLLGTSAGLSLYPARLFRPGANGFETIALSLVGTPYTEERIHHFASCALDNRKPLVAPEQSLKLQELLEAITSSAASGKEVRLL